MSVFRTMQDGSCVLERFPSLETGPLANVLVSEGKPGQVHSRTHVHTHTHTHTIIIHTLMVALLNSDL